MRKVIAQVLARVACASCLRELPCARSVRKLSLAQAYVSTYINEHIERLLQKRCARRAGYGDLLARALREPCASSRELIYVYAHIRVYGYTHIRICVHACIRTFRHTDIRQICLRELLARELARVPCASPLREQLGLAQVACASPCARQAFDF